MIAGVDEIHEADGGELGGLMGWLLYGDVDLFDVELFMAEEVAEWFPDGGDWEVTEVYVRKVPREWGFVYAYAPGPGRGARKATRIEQYRFWGHWCMNHIYEPATTGIPVERVADPIWPMVITNIVPPERRRPHRRWPQDGDPTVYLCRDCTRRFHEREEAARREALAAMRKERAS